MNGGKMLWMLDQLRFDMDSLKGGGGASMAVDYGLNLDDMLFKYGVRINSDLIEDYQQCNPIPVTVGVVGNQPDIKLLPWVYHPFSISTSKHPIVNNLDAVMFLNANSIDTIANLEIKKTILLSSSNRSRRMPSPVRISLSNLKFKPQADMFREKIFRWLFCWKENLVLLMSIVWTHIFGYLYGFIKSKLFDCLRKTE